jgi:ribose transport system permease protein
MSEVAAVWTPRLRPLPPAMLRTVLPFASLALMLAAIGWLNPRAISYMGFNLMLNLAVPVALATIAQMLVITVNELVARVRRIEGASSRCRARSASGL